METNQRKFHGTKPDDAWDVAGNPQLDRGRTNLDFNTLSSFYLTSSFAWAAKTSKPDALPGKEVRKDRAAQKSQGALNTVPAGLRPVVAFKMRKRILQEKFFSLSPVTQHDVVAADARVIVLPGWGSGGLTGQSPWGRDPLEIVDRPDTRAKDWNIFWDTPDNTVTEEWKRVIWMCRALSRVMVSCQDVMNLLHGPDMNKVGFCGPLSKTTREMWFDSQYTNGNIKYHTLYSTHPHPRTTAPVAKRGKRKPTTKKPQIIPIQYCVTKQGGWEDLQVEYSCIIWV